MLVSVAAAGIELSCCQKHVGWEVCRKGENIGKQRKEKRKHWEREESVREWKMTTGRH